MEEQAQSLIDKTSKYIIVSNHGQMNLEVLS